MGSLKSRVFVFSCYAVLGKDILELLNHFFVVPQISSDMATTPQVFQNGNAGLTSADVNAQPHMQVWIPF